MRARNVTAVWIACLTVGSLTACGIADTSGDTERDASAPRTQRDESAPPPTARPDRPSGGAIPRPPRDASHDVIDEWVDGDTLTLRDRGRARVVGVDTPEVFGGVECFGREASAFVKRRWPPGTPVRYTLGAEERDRYDRWLVYVWLRGEFANVTVLRAGYAKQLTIPPNVEYEPLFRRAVRQARRADRGLWARGTCDQPPRGRTAGGCDPGYEGACVPPYPPDVDCADLDRRVTVAGDDPHELDGDRNGTACEG